MKTICYLLCLCCLPICISSESKFLLSSEQLSPRNSPSSLKELNSLMFSFLLRMEPKEVDATINFIDQELGKAGKVVKREIFTEKGMDLECLANPSMQFSIEKLVDKEGKELPVLKAQLLVNATAKIGKSQQQISPNISSWTVYLKDENQGLQKALRDSLPDLLKQFSAAFQEANQKDSKPTFFIIYDASWFKNK